MSGQIVLFEDQFVGRMAPITLTRPAFGVRCAVYNLYDIVCMTEAFVTYVVRDWLREVAEMNYESSPLAAGPKLFLNAAVAPDVRYLEYLEPILEAGEPFLCTSGQRVTAALVPEQAEVPDDLSSDTVQPWLLELGLPVREREMFKTFDYPFHVVGALKGLFPQNIVHKIESGDYRQFGPGVFVGEGVEVADTAVFHSEEGPIVLDEGARVLDFTYFHGPLYIGPNSRIIERSSVKEYVSVSHTCKIGGEVEASTIEPYTNKQHHGFLGHAYVGSWVNMGAGTSNSDLKNTYGEVRMQLGEQRVETGMQFLGCIMGDYCKTAINTSIFTGKIIGVNSMLYGLIGQNVPSFTNYARTFGQVTEVGLEQAVVTQRRMFARRDVEQTEADVKLLRTVFRRTRAERRISSDPPVL
ncbi:MAG: putative sugar nucleotidyl transferase [Candidatus Brocadiia bacterium]